MDSKLAVRVIAKVLRGLLLGFVLAWSCGIIASSLVDGGAHTFEYQGY